MMSLPEVVSRLPVGSSARTSAGLAGQRAGDRDALHLAAGELGRPVVHAVGEADLLEQQLDPRLALARAVAVEEQRHLDVLEGGDLRQQVEVLEDEADLAVADVGELVDVELRDLLAVEAVGAAARRVEAADDVEQGRLAGAGRTDDGDELAGLDLEVEPLAAPRP